MTGYRLSREAERAEARWAASREGKDITPWRASQHDRDNFTTNRVTLAEFDDSRAAGVGAALGLSTVWACINLLAGTIGSLPLMIYRTDRDGVRTVARDHPLWFVLHESANYHQTATDFWEYAVAGIELQGNAFATIEKRSNGEIVSLVPIRPDAVKARRVSGGRIEYSWSRDGVAVTRPGDEVLHIRGPLGDDLSGASTLSVCRQPFALASYADYAAKAFFENGVRPSGILSTDPTVKLNADQRVELDTLMAERFMGAMKSGRPMILDRGMTWHALQVDPADAQMLETRQFSVEEVCRIFGVPPHMVGHTANSTSWGTGLEQQTLGFVKFSLRRRLKRIEMALGKQLLTARDRAEGITIEFNLEGLLRGDSGGRASFYQSGLSNGWMTINEVRRLENMPPIPGGDVPRMQSQNIPITEAGSEGAVQ